MLMDIHFSLCFTKGAVTGLTLRNHKTVIPSTFECFILVCQTPSDISILEVMTPKNLALRPNCLLTRSPLVFLSGPRSLFSPQRIGNNLQDYLLAHGYQVSPLPLPFRSKIHRQQSLLSWLKRNQSQSFHFFMAAPTWVEFQNELLAFFHPQSTLTVLNLQIDTPRPQIKDTKLNPFSIQPANVDQIPFTYRLHQIYSRLMGASALPYEQTLLQNNSALYDRVLDHCIELAEDELNI